MIYLYTGKTGAGKTLQMVTDAHKEWKKGATIYTNFKIFFDKERVFYYENLSELNEISNAIILMDEAQVLIDSREWDKLPQEFAFKLSQHRKHRLDLYATTQEVGLIDLKLRVLIQEWKHCESLLTYKGLLGFDDKKPTIFHFYKLNLMDLDDFKAREPDESKVTKKKTKIKFVHKWQKKLYDTYTSIGFKPYQILCSIELNNYTKKLEKVVDIMPKQAPLPKIQLKPTTGKK